MIEYIQPDTKRPEAKELFTQQKIWKKENSISSFISGNYSFSKSATNMPQGTETIIGRIDQYKEPEEILNKDIKCYTMKIMMLFCRKQMIANKKDGQYLII